MQSLFFK